MYDIWKATGPTTMITTPTRICSRRSRQWYALMAARPAAALPRAPLRLFALPRMRVCPASRPGTFYQTALPASPAFHQPDDVPLAQHTWQSPACDNGAHWTHRILPCSELRPGNWCRMLEQRHVSRMQIDAAETADGALVVLHVRQLRQLLPARPRAQARRLLTSVI